MGATNFGRRAFLKGIAAFGGAAALNPYLVYFAEAATVNAARARGGSPYQNTSKAIAALGGMARFVKKGQKVAIVPNIGWARTEEYAANTNPQVVRCLVDLCKKAGASQIDVFCNPCNDIRVCYEKSGIEKALSGSAARLQYLSGDSYVLVPAVRGVKALTGGTDVYKLARNADVLINVPILKHHGLAGLTICMKNLMGVIKKRGELHSRIHDALPDLAMMIPSHLCVVDATRILKRNGPTGGSLDDVERKDTVIACVNIVEADALGAQLFGTAPSSFGFIAEANRRGMGEINPKNIAVKDVA
ncbi:MAG: DUF362 domain-containing protein [bacterium]|jgi:uncharacterized protein (DUF362 family)